MINNILWDVKNLALTENHDPDDKNYVDVELRGTIVGPFYGDPKSISDKIRKKLNTPEEDSHLYAENLATIAALKKRPNSLYGIAPSAKLPKIKKVIFNNPATIVIWEDETKTIVKAQNDELFDPEKGLAMAITKKALGNEGNYFDTIKKWTGECEPGYLKMHSKLQTAYQCLQNVLNDKKAAKADLIIAMEEASGYLGEGLDI